MPPKAKPRPRAQAASSSKGASRTRGAASSKASSSSKAPSPSKEIDARLKELGDWRGQTLARLRMLIRQADPDVVEEVKWRKPSNDMVGVPVWSHDGMICTGEIYNDKVKLTFARGAALEDPGRLFNAGLEGQTRRAIDFRQGDAVQAAAFKDLVRAAVALNARGKR